MDSGCSAGRRDRWDQFVSRRQSLSYSPVELAAGLPRPRDRITSTKTVQSQGDRAVSGLFPRGTAIGYQFLYVPEYELCDRRLLRRRKGRDQLHRLCLLTVAGLMMFGKGLPIRERFDNIRMDYLDFTNLLPESRWSDRLTYDGTWENNLYNFFRRVTPKLTADLKHPFRMEGIVRIDDTPVHKAIREAMVNMIIHCDLMLTGVLRVEKRDKSFVFINPGSLKLPIDVIRSGRFRSAGRQCEDYNARRHKIKHGFEKGFHRYSPVVFGRNIA